MCHVCGNTNSSETPRCSNCWAQLSDDGLVTEARAELPTLYQGTYPTLSASKSPGLAYALPLFRRITSSASCTADF